MFPSPIARYRLPFSLVPSSHRGTACLGKQRIECLKSRPQSDGLWSLIPIEIHIKSRIPPTPPSCQSLLPRLLQEPRGAPILSVRNWTSGLLDTLEETLTQLGQQISSQDPCCLRSHSMTWSQLTTNITNLSLQMPAVNLNLRPK